MSIKRTTDFILDRVSAPTATFRISAEERLLLMPADTKKGETVAKPLYFNDTVPALDEGQPCYLPMAKPMGIEMTLCPDPVERFKEMRLAVADAKARDRAVLKEYPTGPPSFIDDFFKQCHLSYAPIETDAKFFVAKSLGLDKCRQQVYQAALTARTLHCRKCAVGAAAVDDFADEVEEPEEKKAAQPKTKAKPKSKAKAKAKAAEAACMHVCLEKGARVLKWRGHDTIFTEGGTRNNLRQLLSSARDAGLHRLQLRSLILSMGMHAWLTINGRWLRYQARRADAFDPVNPPFVALVYRIRDLRDPEPEIKHLEKLAKDGCDLLEQATKLHLVAFMVLVTVFVEEFARETKCLRIEIEGKDSPFDKHQLLFHADVHGAAEALWGQFNTQFDTITSRLSWIFLANTDLYRAWNDIELEATGGNKESARSHEPVAVAVKSTGFTVTPPGETGDSRPYERRGGTKGPRVPSDVARLTKSSWFYSAHLPVYMTSLYLTPERPPLNLDRYYYHATKDGEDVPREVAPLSSVLFHEAMMATGGKYAISEAAGALNKSMLSKHLADQNARPDDVLPVRARFSVVNALAATEHEQCNDQRRRDREAGRELKQKTPRVIPTPSLLHKTIRLPWHDPNEGAIEHLLPEYFDHCRRFYGQDDITAQLESMKPQGSSAGSAAGSSSSSSSVSPTFTWLNHQLLVGDRTPFEMYLILDDEKASLAKILLESPGEIAGGQILCASKEKLLHVYVGFLHVLCVLQRFDLAIAYFHDFNYQELVDGARLFRARCLGRAAKLNAKYQLNADVTVTRRNAIRDQFLQAQLNLKVIPPECWSASKVQADVCTARTLDLLASVLLHNHIDPTDIEIEKGSVRYEEFVERAVRVQWGDDTYFLPELVVRLVELYDNTIRVPATVLVRKTKSGYRIPVASRVEDTQPFKSGPYTHNLHAIRRTALSLGPKSTLRDLRKHHQAWDLSALNTAHALLSEDGIPSTLNSFWTDAEKAGICDEIKKVAQGIIDRHKSVGTVVGAAAPSAAQETVDDVAKAARASLQFWTAMDTSRVKSVVLQFAEKLYRLRPESTTPDQCHRAIQMLIPVAATAVSKKRPRDEASTPKEQPKQKKSKHSTDDDDYLMELELDVGGKEAKEQ